VASGAVQSVYRIVWITAFSARNQLGLKVVEALLMTIQKIPEFYQTNAAD
jgi:hypothetical protein